MYVGHVGTGFDEAELARVMALLKPLETKTCPFREQPKTNERPHWVRPMLVAQVRFSEWTADGILRHPVYLGLRDDKKAEEVRREHVAAIRPARRSADSGRRRCSRPRHAAMSEACGPPRRSIGQARRTSDQGLDASRASNSSINCATSKHPAAMGSSIFPTAIS